MKIIFKLGYTKEDQLPRKSQYRTKQMIQLLEYLKSIPGEHLDKRCYRKLYGGQQQRVLLARALCAAKKMLFLDEPVAGLDPEASEAMYQMIRKLNK